MNNIGFDDHEKDALFVVVVVFVDVEQIVAMSTANRIDFRNCENEHWMLDPFPFYLIPSWS